MKTAVQLFGVLRDPAVCLKEALCLVRSLGYTAVEPCISVQSNHDFDHVIWPLDRAEEALFDIRAAGLQVDACHAFAPSLPESAPVLGDFCMRHGIRYLVVKSPQILSEETLHASALNLMSAAQRLQRFGVMILLHNEADDIRTRIHGVTAYEYLLDLCLGHVQAEVDIGWVHAGGEDPEAFLWRNALRVKAVHFKDFSETVEETAIGKGTVNTGACFQFARAFGALQIVDMDCFPQSMEQDLKASHDTLASLIQYRENSASFLNVLDTQTGEISVLHRFEGVIEAPNWLKGSGHLLFNAGGHMFDFDPKTGVQTQIDTGICTLCNNDHVVSPDETELAVSHMTMDEGFSSRVYVLPLSGGEARLVTPNSPSFLHGWSPDGKELAYCAFREHVGRQEVDVYTIPLEGGEEKRLTLGGFNDGPEYAPNGEHIWFNSTRSGRMQAWRMRRDGSEQTQMTCGERNNWFPHVSPDGTKVVYLSYGGEDLEPSEHLPNMQVELWMMNADGSDAHCLTTFFGGQGSINVNSWAADSRHLAFVSYDLRHKG